MKKKRRGVREPDARAVVEAERIHAELGLEQPEDIDILLIAAHLGVVPVARTLTNEQGHVIRSHGRALAAIDRARLRTNEWRWILAHETGHTLLDGAHDDFARCTSDAPSGPRRSIESAANDFAAELLMPRAMLTPRIAALDLAAVRDLADTFDVPVQAMALRLLGLVAHDRAVVYAVNGAVEWFAHGRDFDAVDVRWRKPVPQESAAARATSVAIARQTVTTAAWSNNADVSRIIKEEACISAEGGTVVWMRGG